MVRHARANQCEIIISNEGPLTIEVRDDGIGYAPAAGPGVGVRSMRARAEELGGTFTIEPLFPQYGTRVIATFPQSKEAAT